MRQIASESCPQPVPPGDRFDVNDGIREQVAGVKPETA